MLALTHAQLTHVGHVRKMNQDSVAVLDSAALEGRADALYVVADGMGGRAGGEVASALAVQALPEAVLGALADGENASSALDEGMQAANHAVFTRARDEPELKGMGTTCVAVLVTGTTAYVANVGDSRAYLVRKGGIECLTADHSLVQEHVRQGQLSSAEARSSRFRNVITRSIGMMSTVKPDIDPLALEDGDTLLLCTDGLTNMAEDDEIGHVLATEPTPRAACDKLVALANHRGGRDNTTVIVVRCGAFVPTGEPALELPAEGTVPPQQPERRRRSSHRQPDREEPRGVGRPASERRPSWALPLLTVALACALVALVARHYRVVPEAPFLQERTPSAEPAPARPAPGGGLARITWHAPRVVGTAKLRGAPLACDAEGNIYAVSAEGRLVHIEPTGELSGDFPRSAVPSSTSPSVSMAADREGYVYVALRSQGAIARYDRRGTRVAIIKAGLKAPEGIAVDSAANIYVVDGGRLKVLRSRPVMTGAGPAE